EREDPLGSIQRHCRLPPRWRSSLGPGAGAENAWPHSARPARYQVRSDTPATQCGDDLARSIPIKPGMPSKLVTVYNDLNNPDLAAARARNPNVDLQKRSVYRNYGPKKQGYKAKADINHEL